MKSLIQNLRPLAAEKGHRGGPLTSHDLAALFRDLKFRDETGNLYGFQNGKTFHPMDLFPDCYSTKFPDVPATYTWAGMCLEHDMPKFLEALESEIGIDPDRTFWIDIFFNDQNEPDKIEEALSVANGFYQNGARHAMFIKSRVMSRGWCNKEIATRTIFIMRKDGLNEEQMAEAVMRGDPRFTLPVTVSGLTNVFEDLWGNANMRFDAMETFYERDKLAIQSSILEEFGSKTAFNYLMLQFRNAALVKYARQNPEDQKIQQLMKESSGGPLHGAAECNHVEAIRRLIAAGTDPNVLSQWGSTALHLAAKNGHLDAMQALLERGADCNIKDVCKWTAVHEAARNGSTAAMTCLVGARADLSAKVNAGDTALALALKAGHTRLAAFLQTQQPAEIAGGRTASVHEAAKEGWDDEIRRLVGAGADPDARDDWDATPLHIAAKCGRVGALRALLAAAADAGAVDRCRWTPLHEAARQGSAAAVAALIEAGADRGAKEASKGDTPLDLARSFRHAEAAALLERAGGGP